MIHYAHRGQPCTCHVQFVEVPQKLVKKPPRRSFFYAKLGLFIFVGLLAAGGMFLGWLVKVAQ